MYYYNKQATLTTPMAICPTIFTTATTIYSSLVSDSYNRSLGVACSRCPQKYPGKSLVVTVHYSHPVLRAAPPPTVGGNAILVGTIATFFKVPLKITRMEKFKIIQEDILLHEKSFRPYLKVTTSIKFSQHNLN